MLNKEQKDNPDSYRDTTMIIPRMFAGQAVLISLVSKMYLLF
jgi:hypothetical protein